MVTEWIKTDNSKHFTPTEFISAKNYSKLMSALGRISVQLSSNFQLNQNLISFIITSNLLQCQELLPFLL